MGDRVAITLEMAELGGGDLSYRLSLLCEVPHRSTQRTTATNEMWDSLVRLLRHVRDTGSSAEPGEGNLARELELSPRGKSGSEVELAYCAGMESAASLRAP